MIFSLPGVVSPTPIRELWFGGRVMITGASQVTNALPGWRGCDEPLEPVDGIRHHRNQIDHHLHEVVLVRAALVTHRVERCQELVGANATGGPETLRLWVRLGQGLSGWLDTAADQ
jgi:hypothetical protein